MFTVQTLYAVCSSLLQRPLANHFHSIFLSKPRHQPHCTSQLQLHLILRTFLCNLPSDATDEDQTSALFTRANFCCLYRTGTVHAKTNSYSPIFKYRFLIRNVGGRTDRISWIWLRILYGARPQDIKKNTFCPPPLPVTTTLAPLTAHIQYILTL